MAWEATERIYEEVPIGGAGAKPSRSFSPKKAGVPMSRTSKNLRTADAGSKPLRVLPSDHTFSNNLTHPEPAIARSLTQIA